MGELNRHAVIAAEPERVFRFVADPHNAPLYISSIKRVAGGPPGDAAVGMRWSAQADFLGRPANITLRMVRLEPPRDVDYLMEGDPRALLSLRISPAFHDGAPAAQVWLGLNVPSVPGFLLKGLMGGLLSADMQRLRRLLEERPGGSARGGV